MGKVVQTETALFYISLVVISLRSNHPKLVFGHLHIFIDLLTAWCANSWADSPSSPGVCSNSSGSSCSSWRILPLLGKTGRKFGSPIHSCSTWECWATSCGRLGRRKLQICNELIFFKKTVKKSGLSPYSWLWLTLVWVGHSKDLAKDGFDVLLGAALAKPITIHINGK